MELVQCWKVETNNTQSSVDANKLKALLGYASNFVELMKLLTEKGVVAS